MTDWFYIWDTRTVFGWAVLAGTPHGARCFDFGFRSRDACLKNARLFTGETPACKLRENQVIQHSGPQKGPVWLLPSVVAITRFFLGENASLNDIPLDWSSHSGFETAIWRATCTIPYGETRSYAWVARRARRPRAARATGNALGANPLPVIVPCHRVVKSDGKCGGFGMGVDMKKRLLDLESRALSPARA